MNYLCIMFVVITKRIPTIIICLNFGYRTPEKKRLTFILGPVPSCRARCKYLFKIYLPRNLGNDT